MDLGKPCVAGKDYIMNNQIEYFKKQAKNLYRDYKTRHLSTDGDIHEYDSKYYDITGIFVDYDIRDDDEGFEFSLMKAQHLIATLLDFKCWDELIKATPTQLEIAKVKLGCFTVDNYDPSKIDDYEFFTAESEDANGTTFDDEMRLMLAKYYINGEGEGPEKCIYDGQENTDEEEEYKEVKNAPTPTDGQPDVMLECIHCGERFLSSETKLIKQKGDTDDEAIEVCKYWPECDGSFMDLIPAGANDAKGGDNEK